LHACRGARGFAVLTLTCLSWLVDHSGGFAQSEYQAGQSYSGRSNYVEYLAGDMPVIISAPHGGPLKPAEIPDRKRGEFVSDACTEELARTVQQVFRCWFGRHPHVIVCRLERRKVDCNRDLEEGAGADAAARQVWQDYHGFISVARREVLARTGRGLYIDLHGQSNPIKRVELGYCLNDQQLTCTDTVLNQPEYAAASTIRNLTRQTGRPFVELLRGPKSIGGLLVTEGYPAVPSPAMPDPGLGNSYFDGGYSVRRYGSADGSAIDGLQMEVNYVGVRDTAINRAYFALALARALDAFFRQHYDLDLRTGAAQ
jgi:hypothetical protein